MYDHLLLILIQYPLNIFREVCFVITPIPLVFQTEKALQDLNI